MTLEILPKEATRKTTLTLTATGFDLAASEIEWSINGSPFTTSDPEVFNGADAAPGDTIRASAAVGENRIQSDPVVIKNSLPEITDVKILPEVLTPDDTLSVDAAASDFDEDTVSFAYEWTKNGEPAGNERSIESAVKRDDEVIVTIMPFDGMDYGKPVVIRKKIQNLVPVIVDHEQFSFDGSVYTYQVKASDGDGDRLTYEIESSEGGMTISPSGLVRWVVPREFKGRNDASVTVTDGHGGIASYTFTVTIP